MSEHTLLLAGTASSTALSTLLPGEPSVAVGDTPPGFGQLELGPGELVRVYAMPSGVEFDLMWGILRRRALGAIVLVGGPADAAIAEGLAAAKAFAGLPGGLLVGVTHPGPAAEAVRLAVSEALDARAPGAPIPVLTLDPWDRGQLVTALSVLVARMEGRLPDAD